MQSDILWQASIEVNGAAFIEWGSPKDKRWFGLRKRLSTSAGTLPEDLRITDLRVKTEGSLEFTGSGNSRRNNQIERSVSDFMLFSISFSLQGLLPIYQHKS